MTQMPGTITLTSRPAYCPAEYQEGEAIAGEIC
jgi:hypothetical protein